MGQRYECIAHCYRHPILPSLLLGKTFYTPAQKFGDRVSTFAQYTLFANASTSGTPPIRALFYEFPNEPELFGVDSQFLIGRDILVTPVLQPQVSTVSGEKCRVNFSRRLVS